MKSSKIEASRYLHRSQSLVCILSLFESQMSFNPRRIPLLYERGIQGGSHP